MFILYFLRKFGLIFADYALIYFEIVVPNYKNFSKITDYRKLIFYLVISLNKSMNCAVFLKRDAKVGIIFKLANISAKKIKKKSFFCIFEVKRGLSAGDFYIFVAYTTKKYYYIYGKNIR